MQVIATRRVGQPEPLCLQSGREGRAAQLSREDVPKAVSASTCTSGSHYFFLLGLGAFTNKGTGMSPGP